VPQKALVRFLIVIYSLQPIFEVLIIYRNMVKFADPELEKAVIEILIILKDKQCNKNL
jgi:hypothetical protein